MDVKDKIKTYSPFHILPEKELDNFLSSDEAGRLDIIGQIRSDDHLIATVLIDEKTGIIYVYFYYNDCRTEEKFNPENVFYVRTANLNSGEWKKEIVLKAEEDFLKDTTLERGGYDERITIIQIK